METQRPILNAQACTLLLFFGAIAAAFMLEGICQVYGILIKLFVAFLRTDAGEYLVKEFERKYPDKKISKVKMLDLVLWQTRI